MNLGLRLLLLCSLSRLVTACGVVDYVVPEPVVDDEEDDEEDDDAEDDDVTESAEGGVDTAMGTTRSGESGSTSLDMPPDDCSTDACETEGEDTEGEDTEETEETEDDELAPPDARPV